MGLSEKQITLMMTPQERLGLDSAAVAKVSTQLNDLLANMQVFYVNLRGLHWNIKGAEFFELHEKFELLYDELALNIDAIAERILTLGGTPVHSFSEYLQHTEVPEVKNVTEGKAAVQSLLDAFQILLPKERLILKAAAEIQDEGTADLMSDYIKTQEKHMWMYSAYLA